MVILLEYHIVRKLRLLNTLYFRQDSISIFELASILDASESTVKNDLVKYNLLREDGSIRIDIDKDMRLNLHYTIMSESFISRVLRILVVNPGKQAQYYSRVLSMSKASFYKHVLILNRILERFQAKIYVSDGYRIIAEDEKMFRFYLFFYLSAVSTESSPVLSRKYGIIPQLFRLNGFQFSFFEQIEFWQENYHASLLAVHIVRQSDPRTALEVSDVETIKVPVYYLNSIRSILPQVTRKGVTEALALFKEMAQVVEEEVTDDEMLAVLEAYENACGLCFRTNRRQLILTYGRRILSLCKFILRHFPYNVNQFSVNMKDFYHEYAIANKGVLENYALFINKASEIIGVNYNKTFVMLFYLFVMNVGDYLFVPRKRILFASRYYEKHLKFSEKELEASLKMLKIAPEITIVHISNLHEEMKKGNYDLIFSDSKVEGYDNIYTLLHHNSLLVMEFILNYFKNEQTKILEIE